jgi:hypothetical protein
MSVFNLAQKRSFPPLCNATLQRNLATQPCNATVQRNNHATLQRNKHATLQRNNHATLQRNNHATSQRNNNETLQLVFLGLFEAGTLKSLIHS